MTAGAPWASEAVRRLLPQRCRSGREFIARGHHAAPSRPAGKGLSTGLLWVPSTRLHQRSDHPKRHAVPSSCQPAHPGSNTVPNTRRESTEFISGSPIAISGNQMPPGAIAPALAPGDAGASAWAALALTSVSVDVCISALDAAARPCEQQMKARRSAQEPGLRRKGQPLPAQTAPGARVANPRAGPCHAGKGIITLLSRCKNPSALCARAAWRRLTRTGPPWLFACGTTSRETAAWGRRLQHLSAKDAQDNAVGDVEARKTARMRAESARAPNGPRRTLPRIISIFSPCPLRGSTTPSP